MISFGCESCGTPMVATPDQVGEQLRCPMCNAANVVPAESDPEVKPIHLQATRVNKSTWQIVCPKCKGTHNFRESSLGSFTKCRNCGYRFRLPDAIQIEGGRASGCLGAVLAVGVGVATVIARSI
jgi:DNA-directed RNA polymerase subunit RPC12/RpoP